MYGCVDVVIWHVHYALWLIACILCIYILLFIAALLIQMTGYFWFHRHCAGFVFAPLLNEALVDFKVRWNAHRIRRNKVAGCPHGVPDDLYLLPQLNGNIWILTCFSVIITGVRSYKHPLDLPVWAHCYLEHAYKPDPFYPEEFDSAACAILAQINMSQSDITVSNSKYVYLHLCNAMS